MGKVYKAPIEPPVISYANYVHEEAVAAEQAYVKAVVEFAKANGSGPYSGEIVRAPVADGYAEYAVVSTKPVKLFLLETGDAYQFSMAHRWTAGDIKEMVERDRAWKKLFAAKAGA